MRMWMWPGTLDTMAWIRVFRVPAHKSCFGHGFLVNNFPIQNV